MKKQKVKSDINEGIIVRKAYLKHQLENEQFQNIRNNEYQQIKFNEWDKRELARKERIHENAKDNIKIQLIRQEAK